MWTVIYQPAALEALGRVDDRTAERIMKTLAKLAKDPQAPKVNAKKLKGAEGYRFRIGDWRVAYTLQHKVLVVTVVKIAPRGGAYE